MSLVAEITHGDGLTDTLNATRTEEEYEFEKMDIASVFVDRPQINDVTLEEDIDEVEIIHNGESLFGGILRDVLRGGGEVELVLDSYERYALDAERSAGGLTYDNAPDTTIYSDAIGDVPQLSEGTIDNLTNTATFVFPFASPAKRIRTTAESVGAEVLYRPDKTVDVVDSLGSDKTESATGTVLSPAEQNISGDFSPERESGDKRITHLIMLGAGEGEAQVQATVVPDNDPYDYEGDDKYRNVRRYTPENWTDGDRKSWDARTNKDVTDEDTLGDLGVTLIEEFNAEFLDVEITVEDEDVDLGDEFTIRHPDEQVDHDLRAVDVTRIVDKEGRRYETTFSNRRLTRQAEQDKQIKDTERYNRAFEGSAVTMNTGGGRQPVDGGHDYEFEFYYPDEVEYEHRVKLFVKGMGYRAYSQGAASGGDHDHDVTVQHPQHAHDVTIPFSNLDHSHPVTIPFSNIDHSHPVDVPFSNINHDHNVPLDLIVPSAAPATDNSNPLDMSMTGTGTYSDTWSHPFVTGDAAYALVWVVVTHSQWDTIDEYGGAASLTVTNQSTNTEIISDDFTPSYRAGNSRMYFATDLGDVEGDTVEWELDISQNDGAFSVSYGSVVHAEHSHDLNTNTTAEQEFFTDTTETAETEFFDDVTETAETQFFNDRVESSDARLGTTETSTSDASGDHTHDPEPGIIDFAEYPSNCDVVVNGNNVGVSLGDGGSPFQETVDLSGFLNPGTINRVEVTSDTLGHIQAHLDIDVYRQILGRG